MEVDTAKHAIVAEVFEQAVYVNHKGKPMN